MTHIAIIGSTGMMGQPVTRAFIDGGFNLTVLVRNADSARQIFGSEVRIMPGDLRDVDSLNRLLQGQDGLYLSLSVEPESSEMDFHAEREGLYNVLAAAKRSGIRRIGFLSSLVHRYQGTDGFRWWVFDIKKDAIAKIRQSGIPHTIFYPSLFMEVFEKGGYRQGNTITLFGESKQRMFLVAGSDFGIQVANAFRLDNGNQEYAVQGLEGFTADEAARVFADHYRKTKIRVKKAPLGLLKFLGVFSHKFDYVVHLITSLNNYPERFESERTWQELGKPQTTLAAYAEHA
jgi:hypothetical protein